MIKTIYILSVLIGSGKSQSFTITEFDSLEKCEAVHSVLILDGPRVRTFGLYEDSLITIENTRCLKVNYSN